MTGAEMLLKFMESPEWKEKSREFAKSFIEKEKLRLEKIKLMMSNTDYIEWLKHFENGGDGFNSDDWVYFPEEIEVSDKENVENLYLFYRGIDEYAKQIGFHATRCEFGQFYKVRLEDFGFKIGIMVGQGTIFFFEKLPIENDIDFIDFKKIMKKE